jgi:putative transposase
LGTALKQIQTLDGSTGSNPQARGEYDAVNSATMTLEEVERWMTNFFVNVYHNDFHEGIQTTPLAKYQEGILGAGSRPGRGLPARLSDERKLKLDFMPFEERVIQPNGIQIDNIHYYSPLLRPWVDAIAPGTANQKRKFIFRRDPRDISMVYFFDPDKKEYFDIPYSNPALPAISVWELRDVHKHLRLQGMAEVNETAIFAGYNHMRAIEAEAKKETLSTRRKQQRRKHWKTRNRVSKQEPPAVHNIDIVNDARHAPIAAFEELEHW